MRKLRGEAADLVGWATHHGQDLFHQVLRLDEGGSTGEATCHTHLIHVAPHDHVRPYERPCDLCWPRHRPEAPKKVRRVAIVRTPLVMPVAPVQPQDLRVTSDGYLAVRGASGDPDHPWLILDMNNPLLITAADDQAADEWRTLRTCWATENLYGGQAIADIYDVDRAAVALWRRHPEFPRVAHTIGDRPGWYTEQLAAIERWHRNRTGRTGRPPK